MTKLTQVIDRGLDKLIYEISKFGISADEAVRLISTFATARIKLTGQVSDDLDK